MRPAGIPKSSGILHRRIFVFVWVFHKLVITSLQVLERVSPVPPSCASSDCSTNCHWSTAFPMLPDMIIILQTEPFDTIRHFQSGNTEHLAAFYPDMSSFRDLKNASGRDSKIVRDFALSDICLSGSFTN